MMKEVVGKGKKEIEDILMDYRYMLYTKSISDLKGDTKLKPGDVVAVSNDLDDLKFEEKGYYHYKDRKYVEHDVVGIWDSYSTKIVELSFSDDVSMEDIYMALANSMTKTKEDLLPADLD